MTSRMEYAQQSAVRCRERMTRTADEVAAAISGESDVSLSCRPATASWAAKEVVCRPNPLRGGSSCEGTARW
jgi:hypothetical protein